MKSNYENNRKHIIEKGTSHGTKEEKDFFSPAKYYYVFVTIYSF